MNRLLCDACFWIEFRYILGNVMMRLLGHVLLHSFRKSILIK